MGASARAKILSNYALPMRSGIPASAPGHDELIILSAYTRHMPHLPKSWVPADQQPIGRVIGKRVTPPPGALPNAQARAAMDANARYRTRVPKGIYFYTSHEEMARDRERWIVDAIVQKQRERRA